MINVKVNGINHVSNIENNSNEVFNGVMKMINDHSRIDNSAAKSKRSVKTFLDSSDVPDDELAKALENALRNFIAKEVRKNTENGYVNNTPASKNKKRIFMITKEVGDDIRNMYLCGKTYKEIQQKYSDADKNHIYRIVAGIFDFKPVSNIDTFERRAKYILLKKIVKEMNRRNNMHLIRNLKKHCEYRHYFKNMAWDKAIITPIQYIRSNKRLTALFNEVLDDFKADNKYYANDVNIKRISR